jgi:hypothetical protein
VANSIVYGGNIDALLDMRDGYRKSNSCISEMGSPSVVTRCQTEEINWTSGRSAVP